MQKNRLKRLLIIPAILLGVLIFVLLVKNASKPEQLQVAEKATMVRVLRVPKVDVTPRILATGSVQPGQTWNAVAQVSGKIIELHPRLKKGELIHKDEVLLKIDPADYELAITQAETGIESAQVQLAQIDIQEENSKLSLSIERQSLKLGEEDLKRKKKLLAKKTVSYSDYDKDQRAVLGQKQSVQALLNSIRLYPVERKKLHTEVSRLEAQLAVAKLNLQRTIVSMPFDGRISQVSVEYQQLVNDRLGNMLQVDGVDKAEISVQVSMRRLAGLIRKGGMFNIMELDEQHIGERLGLSAKVILPLDKQQVAWDAQVMRLSNELDPRTRTVGVIVEVEQPYANVEPGKRPPLVKGLFVNVELSGSPIADRLVVPLSAVHEQQVYIVGQDQRLQRRDVKTGVVGSDYVVIREGLKADEQIVLSDLIPAIDGMLLIATEDKQALQQLLSSVTGVATGSSQP